MSDSRVGSTRPASTVRPEVRGLTDNCRLPGSAVGDRWCRYAVDRKVMNDGRPLEWLQRCSQRCSPAKNAKLLQPYALHTDSTTSAGPVSSIQFAISHRYPMSVVKVDRRIRWHYTTTILRLRIGARLRGYRNYKFQNFVRTISRHADGISRYSVPPSAGPLLPMPYVRVVTGPFFFGGLPLVNLRWPF